MQLKGVCIKFPRIALVSVRISLIVINSICTRDWFAACSHFVNLYNVLFGANARDRLFKVPISPMVQVIYNCDDFVVVAKPISISVHCDDNIQGFTALLSAQLSVHLYVVHRLDKVTSGLMIFAKSAQAAAEFGVLFEKHKIQKYYLAISQTKPRKKQGTVKGDMKKSRRSAWMLQNSQKNPAITRFLSQYIDGLRLFLLKPETGKTHQLRVALKSLGSAIYGDQIYNSKGSELQGESDASPDRCYLHAWQLVFCFRGQNFTFRNDPDQGHLFTSDSIAMALEQWADPDQLSWSKRA